MSRCICIVPGALFGPIYGCACCLALGIISILIQVAPKDHKRSAQRDEIAQIATAKMYPDRTSATQGICHKGAFHPLTGFSWRRAVTRWAVARFRPGQSLPPQPLQQPAASCGSIESAWFSEFSTNFVWRSDLTLHPSGKFIATETCSIVSLACWLRRGRRFLHLFGNLINMIQQYLFACAKKK